MRAPGWICPSAPQATSPGRAARSSLLPQAKFQLPVGLPLQWSCCLFQLGVGSHPANTTVTAPNCAGPCDFRLTPSLRKQPFVPNRNCNANIYFSSPARAFKRETMRHHLEPAGSCSRFPLALLHQHTQPLFGCISSPSLAGGPWKAAGGQ